jgi:hypothetical protein
MPHIAGDKRKANAVVVLARDMHSPPGDRLEVRIAVLLKEGPAPARGGKYYDDDPAVEDAITRAVTDLHKQALARNYAALNAARTVEIQTDSTLGIEFTAGDIMGFLTAADASGTVESLYAGDTCFFR